MAHLLVTGGSRGIGAAVCRRAGAAGWSVTANYRANATAAEAMAAVETTEVVFRLLTDTATYTTDSLVDVSGGR